MRYLNPAVLILMVMSGCQSTPVLDLTRASWSMQSSPTQASLRGLCVVDDRVVWASGSNGTVLRTVDGGRTWTERPVDIIEGSGLDYRDIHAFDASRAIVLSAGLPARIYQTRDGGHSWAECYRNDTEGVFFDGMSFWDESRGIAFSDPVDGVLLIIVTDDGGETWQEVDRRGIPPALDGEAGFAASGTGVCVLVDRSGIGHAWIGLGGQSGADGARVFHSADFGHTWQVMSTPMTTTSSAGVFSLVFRNRVDGVAIGGDFLEANDRSSNIAITADGGASWTGLPRASRPRGYRSGVCSLSGTAHLICVGPIGSDYSLDGGQTWTALGDVGFHAVAASADGAAIWATGADGQLSRLRIPPSDQDS